MKAKVITLDNKPAGDVELSDSIFALPARKDILHRVVEWQRSKARSGNHKTKGISEISGTTKKPYKQKGTGNARQGSLRSPQMRGGAVIFGPVVRSHEYDLPKKIRKLGLKTALSVKNSSGKLAFIDEAKLESSKTKDLLSKLSALGWTSVLFIDGDKVDDSFKNAAANLYRVDVLPQIGANVLDILKHDMVVITKSGLELLEARLK